jgi:hydroxymethylpyrimidine pyrophosphatase-like HAD family hydrolase
VNLVLFDVDGTLLYDRGPGVVVRALDAVVAGR